MNISVIVPVFNEEKVIGETLRDLRIHHDPHEVIVVDGGSADQTVLMAAQWATVLESRKGRAVQMNAGARHAKGDVLLFLHADTRLPKNGLKKIKEVVSEGNEAGRFRMKFDSPHWLLRFYESYTRFHVFSYGDQAFFVKKELFQRLDGFHADVPFEDIDFYKRLRQLTKPVILKNPVTTSARRFQGVGFLKQKFINLFLVCLYYLGVDVFKLKLKLYPEVR